MIEGLNVEATGPSISQLISATNSILKFGFLASSLLKINGEPSFQKWQAM